MYYYAIMIINFIISKFHRIILSNMISCRRPQRPEGVTWPGGSIAEASRQQVAEMPGRSNRT